MKKPIVLRILAAVAGVAVIACLCMLVAAFTGNPITAAVANQKIEQYLNQNYSFLSLEKQGLVYNFKFGTYDCTVQDKNSIDTRFTVSYRRGKVTDTYAYRVIDGGNTIDRMATEYSALIKSKLSLKGYDVQHISVFSKSLMENSEKPKLDQTLDPAYFEEGELVIHYPKSISEQETAKIMQEMYVVLQAFDYHFYRYTLYVGEDNPKQENNQRFHGITNVAAKDLDSPDFIQQVIQKAQQDLQQSPNPSVYYASFHTEDYPEKK